jgi:hypothetical protein
MFWVWPEVLFELTKQARAPLLPKLYQTYSGGNAAIQNSNSLP